MKGKPSSQKIIHDRSARSAIPELSEQKAQNSTSKAIHTRGLYQRPRSKDRKTGCDRMRPEDMNLIERFY